MRSYLLKRWFLVSLLVLIPGGLALGSAFGEEMGAVLESRFLPPLITSVVLFLMSFSLDGAQLKRSLRYPGPVLLAFAVNFGVIPLLGSAMMRVQLQLDFEYGLMIAASVPCTMAAASVWTRKAGGNDAVSLFVTVSTNGLCFVITPFWLNLTTTGKVELDFWTMFWRLVITVLIPTLLGQLARLLPLATEFARRRKTAIGAAAQMCILTIIVFAACTAGLKLAAGGPSPSAAGVALVWGCCILLHVVAMGIGLLASRAFGFARADLIAVVFASSQKTIPIGLLIATDAAMFGDPNLLGPGQGLPFVVFPMLMFHASQLFIDTAVADHFAAAESRAAATEDAANVPATAKAE
jgi:solute carrier family 10 (sodium/bile acid cotransporter), member 7